MGLREFKKELFVGRMLARKSEDEINNELACAFFGLRGCLERSSQCLCMSVVVSTVKRR
jgi:hypothetical protein